jgi:hypothetical protein
VSTILAIVLTIVLAVPPTLADEGPISGTVKAVDVGARTLTLEVASNGKTRMVIVYLKPEAKVVRFVRLTEPGKTGFVEQEVPVPSTYWSDRLTPPAGGIRDGDHRRVAPPSPCPGSAAARSAPRARP